MQKKSLHPKYKKPVKSIDACSQHDSRAVANYFINKLDSINTDEFEYAQLTPLSLQKLVYIANALSLLDNSRPLVNESPKVGKYDPFFPTLKDSLAYFGGKPVISKITEGSGIHVYLRINKRKIITAKFEEIEIEILNAVWSIFQSVGYDCTRLTYLTGGTQKEFKEMKTLFSLNGTIPDKHIKSTVSSRLLQPKISCNNKEAARAA